MRHSICLKCVPLFGSAMFAASMPQAVAATLYWDTNGITAGSGNAGGTWETGGATTNWNATADGTGTTQAWADGDSAIFSAGTDGTTAKNVTVTGIVKTPLVRIEEVGLVNLLGGTIDITGGATFNTSVLAGTTGRSMDWTSKITGTGALTIAGHGDTSDTGGSSNTIFTLSGANDFTGNVTITSGVIRATSGFGAAGNKVILNGGGLVDPNLNLNFTRDIQVDAGFTGVYRTWGSVSTGQISGAILGGGTLKHTDGGTLTLSGNGSAFTGTYNNARGNTHFTSANWSGTTVVNSDTGNAGVYFKAAGETTIKAYSGDRDVFIDGTRLNISSGTFDVTPGTGNNNFWVQTTSTLPTGKLTSSSGTLTLNWNTGYDATGTTDRAIRVIVEDYNASTPLAVVKNGTGAVARFDKANTYTGGTTINAGRINAENVQAFGTGKVTITSGAGGVGGQAFLAVAGTYANQFDISGIGSTEAAGNLGAIRYTNNVITSGAMKVSADSRLVAYSGASATHSGAITGTGDLEINFAANTTANGTISITGDTSGFTGDFIVSRGVLNLNSSTATGIGSGAIVSTSGTLGGIGTITGNVSVDGTLSPGNSPGTRTIGGNLSLSSTAVLRIELNPLDTTTGSSINDHLSIGGNLALDGTVNVTATSGTFAGVSSGTWTFASYSGSLTDNGLNLGTMPALDSGLSWALKTSDTGSVSLTIVPEPGTALLGLLGLLFLGRRRR